MYFILEPRLYTSLRYPKLETRNQGAPAATAPVAMSLRMTWQPTWPKRTKTKVEQAFHEHNLKGLPNPSAKRKPGGVPLRTELSSLAA